MPVERASERLKRLVVLVPWIMAHEGCTVGEVSARFGITRDELIADLDIVFLCGLPPFGPGDLIDVALDGDRVSIRMADYLATPPRLTRSEAIAMLVMGRAIAGLPGFEEAAALRRALAKLAEAIAPGDADEAALLADRIGVDLTSAGTSTLADVRGAAVERARMRIEYFSAGRAEMTEREVDPLLLVSNGGNWYVIAIDHLQCDASHRRCEERTFRVDRIRVAQRTGQTFTPPDGFDPGAYAEGPLFSPRAEDLLVQIEIDQRSAWLEEVVPAERVTESDGGRKILDVRTAHLAWLVRLLLSATPHARAVAPPELRDAVRAAAARALARYA